MYIMNMKVGKMREESQDSAAQVLLIDRDPHPRINVRIAVRNFSR
jgi:hypothetical protein